jgi:hypothetical protein
MDTETLLKELLDREAIRDLSRRYAMGIDLRDWAMYRSIFTDEIEADFTSWAGGDPAHLPADAWVEGVKRLAGFQATQHMIVPYVVDFTGPDEATSLAYMYAQHFLPNDKGDNFLWIGGHYTNHVVRTASGWKFDKVKLTVGWTIGNRNIFDLANERSAARSGGSPE